MANKRDQENNLIRKIRDFFSKNKTEFIKKRLSVSHLDTSRYQAGMQGMPGGSGMGRAGSMAGGGFVGVERGGEEHFQKSAWEDRYLVLSRPRRYAEYNLMTYTPEIEGSIETYVDEGLTKDYYGNVVTVNCTNEEIKEKVIEFLDTIEFEKNVDDWMYSMLVEGDQFVPLKYDKQGVVDYFTVLDPLKIEISEQFEEDIEQVTRVYNYNTEIQKDTLGNNEEDIFYEFEVLHFSYKGVRSKFYPYGQSLLETLRPAWRNLIRSEDAMLLHRIARATDRKIFYVEIGGLDKTKAREQIKKLKNSIKTDKYVDSHGNQAEKPKTLRILDDFFVPKRNDKKTVDVDTLKGTEMKTATDDVEYFKKKIYSKLRVPPAFLGDEKNTSGKNLLSQQDFRFARTIERIQRIITEEVLRKSVFHVLASDEFDIDDVEESELSISLVNPSTIYLNQRLELVNNKISAANDAKRSELLSEDYIYQTILGFSDEDIQMIKSQRLGDKIGSAVIGAIEGARSFSDLKDLEIDWKSLFKQASPALKTVINALIEDEEFEISFEPEDLENQTGTRYTFNQPDTSPMSITGEQTQMSEYNSSKIGSKMLKEIESKNKLFKDEDKRKGLLNEVKKEYSERDVQKEIEEKNNAIKSILREMT